jgi:hypothetical protein
LAEIVSAYIRHGLDYNNFKAEQDVGDPAWARFFHAVWGKAGGYSNSVHPLK